MAVMGFKRLLPILFELSVLGAADESLSTSTAREAQRDIPVYVPMQPDQIKSMVSGNPSVLSDMRKIQSVLHNPSAMAKLIGAEISALSSLVHDERALPTITNTPRPAASPPRDWGLVLGSPTPDIAYDPMYSSIWEEIEKHLPYLTTTQATVTDVEKRAQPTITDDLTAAAASGLTPVLPASVSFETSEYDPDRHITHLSPSATTKARNPMASWFPPVRQVIDFEDNSEYTTIYVGASDGTDQHVEEAVLPAEIALLQARTVETTTVDKTKYIAKPVSRQPCSQLFSRPFADAT